MIFIETLINIVGAYNIVLFDNNCVLYLPTMEAGLLIGLIRRVVLYSAKHCKHRWINIPILFENDCVRYMPTMVSEIVHWAHEISVRYDTFINALINIVGETFPFCLTITIMFVASLQRLVGLFAGFMN